MVLDLRIRDLCLLSEAAWEGTTLLRAKSEVVEGGLFRSLNTRISIECTHDSMGAAVHSEGTT